MDIQEKAARVITWIGVFVHFIASNYSILLSVACGVGALSASIYSIVVNRARLRILKEMRHPQRSAINEALIEEE